ncbi:MAG: hypothetical protein Q4E73_01955 [Lachnospiraceae bacterium]|nr:hypothetical protein [Lachnospiraceae bacterium]
MKFNDVKEVLQPYFEKNLIRVVYDNSEITILNVAESEYVSVYKQTEADRIWGLLIPKEDLTEAAEHPYDMLPRYSLNLSCENQVVVFDEEYMQKAVEMKKQTDENGISAETDSEIEIILQSMMKEESYDHSQPVEHDKDAAPAEKTLCKCLVADKVDADMVKEDLNLNNIGFIRNIILWLLVAVCLYQFGKWIPSMEKILEILCAVCIFKAGTDLILLPRRKKEGSKAKIRVQYHTCLKKFYTGSGEERKVFILMDTWDVFEVTGISNWQVLWEGDTVGYVFVDGRMVKDFFYIKQEAQES